MKLNKGTIVSDLWYTDPQIFKTFQQLCDNKPLLDFTTDDAAIELNKTHGVAIQKVGNGDFLHLPDHFNKWKLNFPIEFYADISVQNPPYSIASGGAGVFVEKHIQVCQKNNLESMNILNAAIGAKWFHAILKELEAKKLNFSIGFVEGRINFWGQWVEWNLNGLPQEATFIAALQPYLNKEENEVEITKFNVPRRSNSPRYDNIFLAVAPKGEVVKSNSINLVEGIGIKHNIVWLSK